MVRKIILVIALAVAASTIYQTWINQLETPLWFSNPVITHAQSSSSSLSPVGSNLDYNLSQTLGLDFQSHPPVNSQMGLDFQSYPPVKSQMGMDQSRPPVNSPDKSEIDKNLAVEETAQESASVGSRDKSEIPRIVKSPVDSRKGKAFKAFLERQQELLLAKKEIESYVGAVDDRDLYRPLYHNVCKFKKSYELMEKIFKIYVYREGPKPYFHQPELKGIYASEGWFMKLMDQNKQFVVKDPWKAHMFYLPYSLHRLVEGMYDPNSHNLHPISLFLRDYVNMIASKHPFWNRTQGTDHFFVACHDWGPYTTTEHPQLRKNAIKVLCNADLSEGYFVLGKDVSLPETTLRKIAHPTGNIGGKAVSERSILAFFAGNIHGRVRPILLKYWKGKDDDMKIYHLLPARVAKKMSYSEHMKSSKYCICPMGYERRTFPS
ncbi:hypothetical protein SUGI_0590130 [Cryptomeria japonica]|nr:hypothetical protein SUGI_0590130 [Cryptomeria japonica]